MTAHDEAASGSGITADAFWAWTLAYYQDPAVPPAFATLQDSHGADVNLLLALLWLAAQGAAPLTEAEIGRLDAAIAPWRAEVVVPLRTLRRGLKGRGEDAVRKPIAAAELESERSAQRRLVQALPPHQAGTGSIRSRAEASYRCYNPALPSDPVSVLLDRLADC